MQGVVTKGKVAKIFMPIIIYSSIFLIIDYFTITNDKYMIISKYFRDYYSAMILLYCMSVALSIYLHEVFPWIYFAIPCFTINILFLFSDNGNINQVFIGDLSNTITRNNAKFLNKYLTYKYYINNILIGYLMLMVAVVVHSERKRMSWAFNEEINQVANNETDAITEPINKFKES